MPKIPTPPFLIEQDLRTGETTNLEPDDVYEPDREYTNKDCNQFVNDMVKANLAPYHYRGRFFWQGPAVDVDSIQDALSNTKVKCQWDQMGRSFVVYPVARDEGKPL